MNLGGRGVAGGAKAIRVPAAVRLPRFGLDWRCRWLVLPSWQRLHRVAAITWEDNDKIAGYGVTACCRFGHLKMPGLFSRMGLPRCSVCCDVTGVPLGDGAPFNAGIDA